MIATVSVLTFVTELVRIHQSPRSPGAGPALIAASITERERWTQLLREVIEIEEGVLVDATLAGDGVECGDLEAEAPDLTTWVHEMLDAYNVIDPTAELSLHVHEGRARVLGHQDYEAANAAQRAFREILTSVCADAMRSAPLVAFVFAQDALDDDVLTLIWDGLMHLPQRLGSDESATLAIVAGDGHINFDVHCTGDPSLRFRISEHGLSVRHPLVRSLSTVRAFGRQSASDMPLVVIFMGAGASITAGMPLGDQLRNKALERATGNPVDAGTFVSVASDWYAHLLGTGELSPEEQVAGIEMFVRDLTLERVLQQEQSEENQTFSATLRGFAETHAAVKARVLEQLDPDVDTLARICAARRRLVLLTVNFDQIIEARGGDNVRPFITEAEMLEFPEYLEQYAKHGGPVPLVKLHGDIDHPETLVANLQQTTAGLSVARDAALMALVSSIASQPTHPWIYVGYSMRDRDLEQAWAAPRMATFNEHWVSPFLDPVVARFIETKRALTWQRNGRAQSPMDRLISLTAEDFYLHFYEHVVGAWD